MTKTATTKNTKTKTKRTKRSSVVGTRRSYMRSTKPITAKTIRSLRNTFTQRGIPRKSQLLSDAVLRNYASHMGIYDTSKLRAIVPDARMIDPTISVGPSQFPTITGEFVKQWRTSKLSAKPLEFTVRYVFEHYLRSAAMQPLLQFQIGEDTDITYGYAEEPFFVRRKGLESEDHVYVDMDSETQVAVQSQLLAAIQSPKTNGETFNGEYIPTGDMIIEGVKRFTSPLEAVVRDSYTISHLRDVPMYFIVYKRPTATEGAMKATAKHLTGTDSHYSLMVLWNERVYSIGFGMFGPRKTGSAAALPAAPQVGALYNPDYVLEGRIVGETRRQKLPYKLDLVDVGLFKRKHLDRIMEFVRNQPTEMTVHFNPEEMGLTAAPSSAIIALPEMTYRTLTRTCPTTEGTDIRKYSFNCTSFMEYVFRERIACSTSVMFGIVHPEACRQTIRGLPPLDSQIEAIMSVYEGTETREGIVRQVVEYLDAEASP
jgi:hypothetical protein